MRFKRDKILWLRDELHRRNQALATARAAEAGLQLQLANVSSVKKRLENELVELRYENASLAYPGRRVTANRGF